MEGNITHTWLKNQKSIIWRKSFKCIIKGTHLTNQCTWLDILSLPPVATIFPFRIWRNVKSIDVIQLKLRNMKISHHIFVFKFILLSIFYSSSLYHSTNVIMLLDSFFHVVEMLKPTDVIRLELQSLKVAKMLSLLMLRLELQNMKISHYILSSNLYY